MRLRLLVAIIGACTLLYGCASMAPTDDEFPAFYWPPAETSETVELTGGFPADQYSDYQSVADAIATQATAGGFTQPGYYRLIDRDTDEIIPGFAMVTSAEEIMPTGDSYSPRRWIRNRFIRSRLSASDLIFALFNAPQGHYRTIVFAVTSDPGGHTTGAPSEAEVLDWARDGALSLGPIGSQPLSDSEKVYAFIYQFEKSTAHDEARLANTPVGGLRHLTAAGFNFSEPRT